MSDETQALPLSGPPPDERLEDILAEYLRQLEQGVHVDQQALLAAHPDLADDLREFFGNQLRMQRLVGAAAAPAFRNGPPTKLKYFGDYEILEEIAHGGMGVVYKARQTSLNRIVAVKMILAGQLANESDVKRFQAEAEAAANLHHPGVVGIYEVGINAGQHYYSMEYVDGQNLAQAVREKPLSVAQAAEFMRDIATVLEYAHARKVLHRDLKPSNILLDATGRVRITDFGLAKRVEGESDLTMTGQVLGTPSYMSPEQAAAQHAIIGPPTDIYALGAILYELVTGRPPFRSESVGEILRQVQHDEPVRPRLLNPKLPRDLETICLKCLEKEPRRRYGSARLLAEDLGRYLRGEPILARPISRPARAWRWCKRKPVVAGLSGLLVASLILGTSVSTFFSWRAGIAASAATTNASLAQRETTRANAKADEAAILAKKEKVARLLAINQKGIAETKAAEALRVQKEYEKVVGTLNEANIRLKSVNSALDRGKVDLHQTLTRLAGTFLRSHRPEEAIRQLDALPSEGQTWEGRLYRKWARPLLADVPHGCCAAFSSSGKLLVIGDREPSLRIEEFATGHVTHRLKLQVVPLSIVLNSDATTVAFVTTTDEIIRGRPDPSRTVFLWHPQSGRLQELGPGNAAAFDSNGKRLVTVSAINQKVSIWELVVDAPPKLADQFDMPGVCAVSSNAACVAALDGITLKVLRLDTRAEYRLKGTEPSVDPPAAGEWANVNFSQDGRLLAATKTKLVRGAQFGAITNTQLLIWDVVSSAVQRDDYLKDTEINSLKFSPDGTQLVCGAAVGSPHNANDVIPVYGVHVRNVKTGELTRTLPWHSQKVTDLAFSPDSQWLTSAESNGLKVWEFAPITNGNVLVRDESGSVWSVAISGDGLLVASCGTENTDVRLWNTDSGMEICRLPGNRQCVRLEFSPDGRFLASAGDKVVVWEIASRLPVLELEDKSTCVAFSPDGKQLAVTRSSRTEIYDLDSRCQMSIYPEGDYGVAFHPSGKLIAHSSAGHGHVLRDLTTGAKLWGFNVTSSYRVAFSPKDDWVAFGHGMGFGKVYLRHTASGELVRAWSTGVQPEFVVDICFSPDGDLLATVNIAEVGLWDPATGQKLLALTHPDILDQRVGGRSYAVAFSRDGRRAVAGWSHMEGYSSITVWDTEIGRQSVKYRWLERADGLDPPIPPRLRKAPSKAESPPPVTTRSAR